MSATSAAHLNQEKHCTMLVNYDLKPNITKKQLKETLEASPQNVGDEERIEAMKTLLLMQLNGEDFSHMLMTIIQYVLPHPNKILKKLAYYYLETMNRREVGTGRMRPDLLMVWYVVVGMGNLTYYLIIIMGLNIPLNFWNVLLFILLFIIITVSQQQIL